MAEVLKGKGVGDAMKERLAAKNAELIEKGVTPCLNIVRIGERPDDMAYERGALKRFEGIGIQTRVSVYPEDITWDDFEKEFTKINSDPGVHGILLFKPFPKHIDEDAVKRIIDPGKDVDGMCDANIAKVFAGDETGFAPCTPTAVIELLKHYEIPLKGAKVVLVGRSMVVGKPLAMLLLKENATVTVCHTRTADLPAECRAADVLIAAAGAAKMIGAEHVKEGAVVIDVGINLDEEGNLCGDVDFEGVEPLASKITPVPGGVGSVTTSILAMHTLMAAERSLEGRGQ